MNAQVLNQSRTFPPNKCSESVRNPSQNNRKDFHLITRDKQQVSGCWIKMVHNISPHGCQSITRVQRTHIFTLKENLATSQPAIEMLVV